MFGVGINPAFSTPECFPLGEKMLLLYPKSAQPTSSIRMKMIFGPEENEYRYLETLPIHINRDAKESKLHHRINLPVPVDWSDDFSEMDSNPKTKKILCFMIFMITIATGFAL